MPETTTEPAALPGWVHVGAKVASFGYGHTRQPGVSVRTITKIGKRDIVLDDGERFSVRRLERSTGGSWGYTYSLLPLTDQRVVDALAAKNRLRTAVDVEKNVRDWRDSGDEATLRAMIDALSAHLPK